MNLKTMCTRLIITSTVLSQASYAVQNTLTFKNQRGSVLELRLLDNNKIEGSFITAVASKTCPEAIGKKRPVQGFIVGNAISMSIAYPLCGSVLSISGHFTKNEKGIDTISILNRQSEDITHEGPGARFIGHDSYKKIG